MCAVMTACTPALDRGAERQQRGLLERLDDRQLVVRVLRGVAVAGEVLRAGGDARALEAADRRGDVARDELSVGPNERMPITGFCGFVFTSATGAKSRFTPTSARSAPIAPATRSVSSTSSTAPSAALPGIRAAGRDLEPRHVPALLVDPDQDLALRAQHAGQLAQLLGALDVPAEQDDAAEALREPPPNPVRRDRPLEARQDHRERVALGLIP